MYLHCLPVFRTFDANSCWNSAQVTFNIWLDRYPSMFCRKCSISCLQSINRRLFSKCWVNEHCLSRGVIGRQITDKVYGDDDLNSCDVHCQTAFLCLKTSPINLLNGICIPLFFHWWGDRNLLQIWFQKSWVQNVQFYVPEELQLSKLWRSRCTPGTPLK